MIETFTITDNSVTTGRPSGREIRFDVTWRATDGGNDIRKVTVNMSTQSGQELDSVTTSFAGTGDTGTQTNTLTESGDYKGRTITVTVTVYDANGHVVSQSETETVG